MTRGHTLLVILVVLIVASLPSKCKAQSPVTFLFTPQEMQQLKPPKWALQPAPTVMVLAPPDRYVHKFAGKLVIMTGGIKETRPICKSYGLPANTDSCSYKKAGKCYLVIPDDGPARDMNAYARHELAHCNGWSGNHDN